MGGDEVAQLHAPVLGAVGAGLGTCVGADRCVRGGCARACLSVCVCLGGCVWVRISVFVYVPVCGCACTRVCVHI